MGSLMAGWSSKLLDSDRALMERNKSLTKEEIHAYWKMQGKNNGTGTGSGPASPTTPKEYFSSEDAMKMKSSAFWNTNSRSLSMDNAVGSPNGDWWTRSKWAFLNEPPVDEKEASAHKYVAQFHVATVSKPQH